MEKKLLFYRRGGLGDTILTFPVLEALKRQGFYIVAVGNSDYFAIAKYAGFIDECYSEAHLRTLQKNFSQKVIFSKEEIPPFPKVRMWLVDYYFSVLGIKKDFSWNLPVKKEVKSVLKGKAVIHAGSGSFKKIPHFSLFERIEKFLKNQGYDVIYFVGEADTWIKQKVKNFWECYEPLEIAKHLSSAECFIGLDSGISHLACYLGVESYVFFGPTDEVVWKPIGKNFKIISLDLNCRPCFPNVCEHRRCLDVERLFEKFLRVFSKRSKDLREKPLP